METKTKMKRFNPDPVCDSAQMVIGRTYRISILTPSLVRFEYAADGVFEDRPTQTVINRRFDRVSFQTEQKGDGVEIRTEHLVISYDGKPFTGWGLSARLVGDGLGSTWRFGARGHNFGGTARTLDTADGAIPLEDGIFGREGYAVLDDTGSMAMTEDGWITPRKEDRERKDIYLFAYGKRLEEGIRDFYRLTGPVPLLPKFALGNWWSRYHRYTQKEYEDLILRFEKENIPLSVAVIDMDWHLTDIDPAYGSGWTGFSWNEELFPDHKAFLSFLHAHHLKTALNLHPAEGIAAHETHYREAAEALGQDPGKKETIPFTPENPEFMRVYFEKILHPLEEEGVDFWWIDWQQGTGTSVKGLDPLWILNYCHYKDSMRTGRRGLTFSRYAGPGSHRYPIGFSGDTVQSWESLQFQPYFTATASNIGYGWWSHDIGGHMLGEHSSEMAARWLEFGTFSPILRLHSTNSPFMGKEPWNFAPSARMAMENYLRLRHKMLPYLYAMNVRASRDGLPLTMPLYWKDPSNMALTWGQEYRNEYYFGTELLVCPITEPGDHASGLGCVKAWIPDGKWYDIFTGFAYTGGRALKLYRDLTSIPVLAREGAILPLQDDLFSLANPESLTVHVFPGRERSFTLTEDRDDAAKDAFDEAAFAKTALRLHREEKKSDAEKTAKEITKETAGEAVNFEILPAEGNLSAIPKERIWTILFRCVQKKTPKVTVTDADGTRTEIAADLSYDETAHTLCVKTRKVPVTSRLEILFEDGLPEAENPVQDAAYRILMQAEMENMVKDELWHAIEARGKDAAGEILASRASDIVKGALLELMTASI